MGERRKGGGDMSFLSFQEIIVNGSHKTFLAKKARRERARRRYGGTQAKDELTNGKADAPSSWDIIQVRKCCLHLSSLNVLTGFQFLADMPQSPTGHLCVLPAHVLSLSVQ